MEPAHCLLSKAPYGDTSSQWRTQNSVAVLFSAFAYGYRQSLLQENL